MVVEHYDCLTVSICQNNFAILEGKSDIIKMKILLRLRKVDFLIRIK